MVDSVPVPGGHDKPVQTAKLVLLGESAVGKSSLVTRFVSDVFSKGKEPTIGAAFLTRKCELADHVVKFEIWDTAGQERFASLTPMYYRQARAALVVYDLNLESSFERACKWVMELQRHADHQIVIALVGNKLDVIQDKAEQEQLSREEASAVQNHLDGSSNNPDHIITQDTDEGRDFADETVFTEPIQMKDAQHYARLNGLLYYQTSAKTGENVAAVFDGIATQIPASELKANRTSKTGDVRERGNGLAPLNGQPDKESCAC